MRPDPALTVFSTFSEFCAFKREAFLSRHAIKVVRGVVLGFSVTHAKHSAGHKLYTYVLELFIELKRPARARLYRRVAWSGSHHVVGSASEREHCVLRPRKAALS